MSRDPWPTDARQRKAWLALTVRDIDDRRESGRRSLLADLLRAAWPSWLAQDQ